jgi:hypothetical protein
MRANVPFDMSKSNSLAVIPLASHLTWRGSGLSQQLGQDGGRAPVPRIAVALYVHVMPM